MSRRARRPPAAPFGSPGQFVFTGGSDIGISSISWGASQASRFAAAFSPGLDYFFARNIALGVDVDLSYADGKGYGSDGSLVETKTSTISAGPRIGINVPLGRVISWYPRLTVGLDWTTRDQLLVSGSSLSVANPYGSPSTTQFGPWIDLYLPLLFHPTSHFFVGIGPGIYHDFGEVSGSPGAGGQRTTVSAWFIVGGYWGGARVVRARSSLDEMDEKPQRFGEAGQWVLTNELGASLASSSYAGTMSASTSAGFLGGFDYFVSDGISVGAGAWVASERWSGVDTVSGFQVATSDTRVRRDTRCACGPTSTRRRSVVCCDVIMRVGSHPARDVLELSPKAWKNKLQDLDAARCAPSPDRFVPRAATHDILHGPVPWREDAVHRTLTIF